MHICSQMLRYKNNYCCENNYTNRILGIPTHFYKKISYDSITLN